MVVFTLLSYRSGNSKPQLTALTWSLAPRGKQYSAEVTSREATISEVAVIGRRRGGGPHHIYWTRMKRLGAAISEKPKVILAHPCTKIRTIVRAL